MSQILYKIYSDEDYEIWNNGDVDTDKNLMMGAVMSIPSLVGYDITAEVLNSGNDCICPDVSGRKVAYELPLILDGKPSTFYAVFDEDRNLINISCPDGMGDVEFKHTFDGITE